MPASGTSPESVQTVRLAPIHAARRLDRAIHTREAEYMRVWPNFSRVFRQRRFERLSAQIHHYDWAELRDGTYADLGIPVRRNAVLTLASYDMRALAAIVEKLTDEAEVVRLAAVTALRQRSEPMSTVALIAAYPAFYANGETRAYQAVLDTLLEDPAASAAPAVRLLLERDGDVQLDAAEEGLLMELANADPEAAQQMIAGLADGLSSEQPFAQQRAVQGLVKLGEVSNPSLAQALDNAKDQPWVAIALGRYRDGRALDPLIDLLGSDDRVLRCCAAETLGVLRDPRAAGALLATTLGDDHETRVAAAAALDGLGVAGMFGAIVAAIRQGSGDALTGGWMPQLPPIPP